MGPNEPYATPSEGGSTQRIAVFAYGVLAYLLFLAVFGYMAGFLLGILVPKGIDDAGWIAPGGALGAVAVNVALIALFGVLHSLLAREHVKSRLHRLLPPAAERSTYVVQSSLCLALAMWLWQPMDAAIWHLEGLTRAITYALFGIGTGIVLWSTFLIDHFELFGLRQIWSHLTGREMPEPVFRTPALYRIVRHPMQSGVVILLFAAPQMTAGHLLFAGTLTAYVLVGLHFEERALLRQFGARYAAYRAAVPMLIPSPFRRAGRLSA
ncbi:MAG: NnrU family protein [Pseudomonadota bacterium]